MENFNIGSNFGPYGGGEYTYNLQSSHEQNRLDIGRILRENEQLRRTVSSLESANRTLNENLLANQYEIRRLSAQIEELKTLYQDSVSARREYDRYLDTVGQVYSVACESADSIIKRAEKSARDMLSVLEGKTKRARENAEKTMLMAKSMHNYLADTYPALVENIKRAFQEVDSFMSSVQTVPQSFDNMLAAQTQALLEIQNEMEEYRKRSRSIIEDAERSGITGNIAPAPVSAQLIQPEPETPELSSPYMPPISLQSEYSPSVSAKPYGRQSQYEPHSRMTLLEQEKIRRQEEMKAAQSTAQDTEQYKAQDPKKDSVLADDNKPEQAPVPQAAPPAVPDPKQEVNQNDVDQPEKQNLRRRRTNVKDLLDKYKNYQLI